MSAVLIVAASLAWWLVGASGFVFWWTRNWDLKTGDLCVSIFAGAVLGPASWLVGWLIHGDAGSRVWVRKRG